MKKTILKLLQKSLSNIGFTLDIDVAESAEEGIKKIHSTSYDLILTDIKMPGMTGNELYQYVNNNVEQSIPIIAMSGTPWLLEESDFDAVIAKPFQKETLFCLIRQFIQRPELQ